jgi:HCOMODA/2-hydroxy-3-carboxy-muconic semialdehyde decarboxylase
MTATPLADAAALHELVVANRILANEGVLDAFGHVSVRHPEHPERYLISRSLGPALVTEADLQCFTLEGEQVGGDERTAYSERAIHGAIYEARPEVLAICHNHALSVIPFGVTDVPMRPVFHMASPLGVDIPKWDIAHEFGHTDMLVRTMEQGRSLARALGARRVVLMRGHGSTVAGQSLREVVMVSVYMEQNARLQLQAMTLGDVHYLSAEESERFGRVLANPRGDGSNRAWQAWAHRAGMSE